MVIGAFKSGKYNLAFYADKARFKDYLAGILALKGTIISSLPT